MTTSTTISMTDPHRHAGPRRGPGVAETVRIASIICAAMVAFFLAIAIPEVAGIAGFAVSVAVSSYWPAVIGVLFAAPLVVVWCRPRVSLPRYLRALERDGGRTGLLDPTGALVTG